MDKECGKRLYLATLALIGVAWLGVACSPVIPSSRSTPISLSNKPVCTLVTGSSSIRDEAIQEGNRPGNTLIFSGNEAIATTHEGKTMVIYDGLYGGISEDIPNIINRRNLPCNPVVLIDASGGNNVNNLKQPTQNAAQAKVDIAKVAHDVYPTIKTTVLVHPFKTMQSPEIEKVILPRQEKIKEQTELIASDSYPTTIIWSDDQTKKKVVTNTKPELVAKYGDYTVQFWDSTGVIGQQRNLFTSDGKHLKLESEGLNLLKGGLKFFFSKN